MMLGATCVHLVMDDPSVFPLQPNAPIVPVVVIVLTIYVLVGRTSDWHPRVANRGEGERGD